MERIGNKEVRALGRNKNIPEKYSEVILEALSHYPELKNVKIDFRLKRSGGIPYGTRPSLWTLFMPRHKRKYIIILLEEASGPMEMALFKNLSHAARLGVLGHELNHVVQFSRCSTWPLLKYLFSYIIPFFKKKIERAADIATIEHGLGRELYIHSIYIRCIPGYIEQRRDIEKYYLKPWEILKFLRGNSAFNTAS